jgi:hypothetical protein
LNREIFITSVDEVLDIGSKQSGRKAVEMREIQPVTVRASA